MDKIKRIQQIQKELEKRKDHFDEALIEEMEELEMETGYLVNGGNEIKFDCGLPICDYIHVDKAWGYCSDKDNQVHSFDICESCYDRWIKTFKIKPTIIE